MNNNLKIVIALRDLIDEDLEIKNLYLSNKSFHLAIEKLIQRLHGTSKISLSEVIYELKRFNISNAIVSKLYNLL